MKNLANFLIESELLLEDRLPAIKNKYTSIPTAHDPEAEGKSASDIVDHIAQHHDPSTAKRHTEWLIKSYKRGEFKLGDHEQSKRILGQFEGEHGNMQEKDINKYTRASLDRHTSDLKDTRERYYKMAGHSSVAAHEVPGVMRSAAPSDAHEACALGKGTKWCTAYQHDEDVYHDNGDEDGESEIVHHEGEPTDDNHFHNYHNPKRGERIIVHTFKDGRRFQSYQERDGDNTQLMDETNNPIGAADRKKYGHHLATAMIATGHASAAIEHGVVTNPKHFEEAMGAHKNSDFLARTLNNNDKVPAHVVRSLAHHEDSDVSEAAIKHENFPDDAIDGLAEHGEMHHLDALVNNHSMNPHHVQSILDNENVSDEHLYALAKNRNHDVESTHIDQIMDHEKASEDTKEEAVKHPMASHEQVTKALRGNEHGMALAATSHPSIQLEHLRDLYHRTVAMDQSNNMVRSIAAEQIYAGLAKHSKTPEDVRQHIIGNDTARGVNTHAIALQRNTSAETLHHVLGHAEKIGSTVLAHAALTHPNTDDSHFRRVLDSGSGAMRQLGAQHAPAHMIDGELNKPHESPHTHLGLLQNENLTKAHLDKLREVPQIGTSAEFMQKLASHPESTSEDLQHVLKHEPMNDMSGEHRVAKMAAMRNPNADKKTLMAGAESSDYDIKSSASAHRNADGEVLMHAMKHTPVTEYVPSAHSLVAHLQYNNHAGPEHYDHAYERLKDLHPTQALSVLRHADTSTETLRKATAHPNSNISIPARHALLDREYSKYNEGDNVDDKVNAAAKTRPVENVNKMFDTHRHLFNPEHIRTLWKVWNQHSDQYNPHMLFKLLHHPSTPVDILQYEKEHSPMQANKSVATQMLASRASVNESQTFIHFYRKAQ